MDKKNYTIITLSMVLLVSLGLNVNPEPTHTCDSREIQAHCFDLSSTGKTCYTLPGKIGGKRCLDKWDEIVPTNSLIQAREWLCDNKECAVK